MPSDFPGRSIADERFFRLHVLFKLCQRLQALIGHGGERRGVNVSEKAQAIRRVLV